MYIIGVDIGNSITKIIQTNENKEIINKDMYEQKNIYNSIDMFIEKYNIKLKQIKQFILTGVGSIDINEDIYNISTKKIDEFQAIANCTSNENCLIASIGTGTAFVLKEGNRIKHLGGTGLGGGTLLNLSKEIIKINSYNEIETILEKGDLSKIDLKLKDISIRVISNLSMETTISNFGKIEKDARQEDFALGILNLIFESIGVMASMAIKNTEIKDVFVIGTITHLPKVSNILNNVSKLHNINFIIPEDSEYGVVIGAINLN